MSATGIEVIGNFFQVLGVQPAIGRLFTPEEARSGETIPTPPVAVALLGNAYWRRQFHSDSGIVGKAIELNGTPVTVVGVLPESFDYGAVFSPGAKVDLFVPLSLEKERMWGNIVTLIGRLKPGVTIAQALDDANRVAPNMYFNVKYAESLGRYKGDLVPVPLKDYVTGKLRRSLIALWFAVGDDSADRRRESLQPAYGPSRRTGEGVCRPRSAWRRPRPHRAPASHGEPRAFRSGSDRRARNGSRADRVAGASGIFGPAAPECAANRQPGALAGRFSSPFSPR